MSSEPKLTAAELSPNVNSPEHGKNNAIFYDYAKVLTIAFILIWIEMWILNTTPNLPKGAMTEFLEAPLRMYDSEQQAPDPDPCVLAKKIEERLSAEE